MKRAAIENKVCLSVAWRRLANLSCFKAVKAFHLRLWTLGFEMQERLG
jgi:hypothetical protein